MRQWTSYLIVVVLAGGCHHARTSDSSSRVGRGASARGSIREVSVEIRPAEPAMANYGGEVDHELSATEEAMTRILASKERREHRALSRMARTLATTAPDRYNIPPALVDELMAWAGLVHPPPRVIVAEIQRDVHGCAEQPVPACAEVLDTITDQARAAMEPLTAPIFGVAVAPLPSGAARLLIAVLEPAIEVEPLPASMAMGASVELRAKLLGDRSQPRIELVDAAGQWHTVAVSKGPGRRFRAAIECSRPAGPLQVEVLAEGRHGPEVAANFPIYCATKPPTTLRVVLEQIQGDVTPSQIEQANFDYLNEERRQRGLPALVWDEQAAAIAREHSADMARAGFVGHRSPTSGDVTDRFQRAGVEGIVMRENVARGYGPQGIHDSLMRSPGHRINMLAEDVTHVGIGMFVAVPETASPGVPRPVFATQNFFTPPGSDAPEGDLEVALRREVDHRRKQQGLPALQWDSVLAAEAHRHAQAIAAGRKTGLRPAVEARVVELGAKGVDRHQVQTNAYEGLVQFDLWRKPLRGHVGFGVAPTGTGRATKGFVLVVLIAS